MKPSTKKLTHPLKNNARGHAPNTNGQPGPDLPGRAFHFDAAMKTYVSLITSLARGAPWIAMALLGAAAVLALTSCAAPDQPFRGAH